MDALAARIGVMLAQSDAIGKIAALARIMEDGAEQGAGVKA